jgi:hypothetical protein
MGDVSCLEDETTLKTMTRHFKTLLSAMFLAGACILTSFDEEDPGPLQDKEKDYSLIDFDRLEMGSDFHISVEQSNIYSIHVEGDRRNLDDLEVYKEGSTLVIKYEDNANRKHNTYITIKMPELNGVNFSGASVSTIKGFESDHDLDFILSGASDCQIDAGYRELNVDISGASRLRLYGLGDSIEGKVSGASTLSAFDYPVREATLDASGASNVKVTVSDQLEVVASGGSSVIYRGNPSVSSNISGGSTVQKD